MSKKNNDSGFTVLAKLLKYTKPYTFYLVFTIVSAVISAIATLYAPVLIGQAVDFIIDINNVDFEKILPIIIKLAVVVIVGAGFQWFMGYCTNILTQRTVRDLRTDAFNKLQRVPLKYIDSTPHGDIIGRVVADIDTVSDGLLQGFQQIFTGSIPMVGGHGTAGAFGPVLEDLGVSGATTLCTAAATFGLVAGSLIGGPIGRRLIVKHDLLKTVVPEDDSLLIEEGKKHERHFSMYAPAVYQLVLAVGAGTVISYLLTMTGMTFPIYIGAMIVAALMRNIGEYTGKITIHMGEINDLGGICLSLFLGIAMITLKLWQLADLALPLIIMLGGQVLLMFLYSYFVVYRIMGRDYDSAVLTAGMCGFGMGATPNAMANMQAICQRYAPSVKAYLLVPLIGSLFADFLNSITITFFINML